MTTSDHRLPGSVMNGATISADHVAQAIVAAPFVFEDGAGQVFTDDGRTIYTENGRPSRGEWGVDEHGRFWSFWPPSYRATYHVTWVADVEGRAIGIRFVDTQGRDAFTGRYT